MVKYACRDLSAEEIDAYECEGVALLRQCVDPVWIERMIGAIDRQLRKPSQWVQDTNPGSREGRFLHDRYLWPSQPDFRDYVFRSGVGELAAQAMRSTTSWTLKCDLTCEYVCRLLKHMDKTGQRQCTPLNNDPSVTERAWVDFSSGYFQRALHKLPKQGSKLPWTLHQNYARDILLLRFGKIDDGVLVFSNRQPQPMPAAA
jgi:hypothetical protein